MHPDDMKIPIAMVIYEATGNNATEIVYLGSNPTSGSYDYRINGAALSLTGRETRDELIAELRTTR